MGWAPCPTPHPRARSSVHLEPVALDAGPPARAWVGPHTRPDWCQVVVIGRFAGPVVGGRFDRHHHDEHDDREIWFIADGKVKFLADGTEQYVQAGDLVLTRAGDDHDVIERYDDLRGFFTETGHPGGGRTGHLHASEADAAGRDVLAAPRPDFRTG